MCLLHHENKFVFIVAYYKHVSQCHCLFTRFIEWKRGENTVITVIIQDSYLLLIKKNNKFDKMRNHVFLR